MAFVSIVPLYQHRSEQPPPGIDPLANVHASVTFGTQPSVLPLAVIGEGTTLGARSRIHSHVVIGRSCRIGDDVIIYPGAVLYDDTVVGDRVIIHANAVIGADGFGYRFHQGRRDKVPQLGRVELGSHRGDQGRARPSISGDLFSDAHRRRDQDRQSCSGRP